MGLIIPSPVNRFGNWNCAILRASHCAFREVRLPRSISVTYPHNPFALADDWVRRSMMLQPCRPDPAGYIRSAWAWDRFSGVVTRSRGELANRRQRRGRRFWQRPLDWAADRSHRRVILEMQSKNLPAIRLSQKFGYEFCGYNDQYYLTQDVALFFAKSLK
jgi:GNAT superfamily N-acetyltransferase